MPRNPNGDAPKPYPLDNLLDNLLQYVYYIYIYICGHPRHDPVSQKADDLPFAQKADDLPFLFVLSQEVDALHCLSDYHYLKILAGPATLKMSAQGTPNPEGKPQLKAFKPKPRRPPVVARKALIALHGFASSQNNIYMSKALLFFL